MPSQFPDQPIFQPDTSEGSWLVDARDEMNLAEFPLTLLSDKPEPGRTSLIYEDSTFDAGSNRVVTRRLKITAPAEYGLPRGIDEDVIVALIQLTKIKNNFSNRRVGFVRSELIALLGWADNGKSYDRLTTSLKRWTVVSLDYDDAWWSKSERRWTTRVFHILDECEINDGRTVKGRRESLPSEIVWNETVFGSFTAGNLKDLDYRLYVRLEYATSKRMLRFLDKRLYFRDEMSFDLKDFAFAHIGLSRGYENNVGKIKEKLRPAIRELTAAEFLDPMDDAERYSKAAGTWRVRFRRARLAAAPAAPAAAAAPPEADPPLLRSLVERGITATTARGLVRDHPAEVIERQVEVWDWLRARSDRRLGRSPSGFLVQAIRDDYAPPGDFASRATEQARRADRDRADRQRQSRREADRALAQRELADREAVDTYLAGLAAVEREALEADAVARSELDPRLFRRFIIRDYVLTLLGRPGSSGDPR